MEEALVYGRRVRKFNKDDFQNALVPDLFKEHSENCYFIEAIPESGIYKPFVIPDIGQDSTEELISLIGQSMDELMDFMNVRMTVAQRATVESAIELIKATST